MAEARLEGGVPRTAGWFVVNAADIPWEHSELRSMGRFGGEGEAHFDDLGIALYHLESGQAMAMYHHEAGQEDFLVLRGEPLLIVEGQERALRAWDLVHCPPRVPHTIVGPGLVLAVGARKQKGSARYPVEPAAIRHGAGLRAGEEPYARFAAPERGPAPPLTWAGRGAVQSCDQHRPPRLARADRPTGHRGPRRHAARPRPGRVRGAGPAVRRRALPLDHRHGPPPLRRWPLPLLRPPAAGADPG